MTKPVQPNFCPFCARATTKAPPNGCIYYAGVIYCPHCQVNGYQRYYVTYSEKGLAIASTQFILENGLCCAVTAWRKETKLCMIDYEGRECNARIFPFITHFDLENGPQIINRIKILATFS